MVRCIREEQSARRRPHPSSAAIAADNCIANPQDEEEIMNAHSSQFVSSADQCMEPVRDEVASIRRSRGSTSTLHLRGDKAVCVKGRAGILWATMEGDIRDYLIPSGERACFTAPGLLVLQGLGKDNEAEVG